MRLKHSKLSEKQAIRLCEHFVAGTPARTAAELVGVNKNSATLFYHRLREIVAARIEDESPVQGEVEIDESYFGGKRKGLRGRGGPGKVAVFGILKRGGRVYTKMIPNVARATLNLDDRWRYVTVASYLKLVRAVGIEPTHLAVLDFESSASTSSTTPARTISIPRLVAFAKEYRHRFGYPPLGTILALSRSLCASERLG